MRHHAKRLKVLLIGCGRIAQSHVEEQDIGLRLVDERGIRRSRRDDLQVGQPAEHRRKRLTHEATVVDDRNRGQLLGWV